MRGRRRDSNREVARREPCGPRSESDEDLERRAERGAGIPSSPPGYDDVPAKGTFFVRGRRRDVKKLRTT